MNIAKTSFICRYAYFWKKTTDIPERTTVCRFFWRVVFVTIQNIIFAPIALIFAVLGTLLAGIFLLLEISFLFLLGEYIDFSEANPEKDFFSALMVSKPIQWLPKIKGHRVLPAYVIGPLLLVWIIAGYDEKPSFLFNIFSGNFLPLLAPRTENVPSDALRDIRFLLQNMLEIGAFSAILFSTRYLLSSAKKKPGLQLFFLYAKAVKEKFCPIITFSPPSDSS